MDLAHDLVAAVESRGADTVFGLPGGGPNLAMVGAAQAVGLRFVLCHGETAACIAASTYGRLTGRPALAVTTRGPGAASAVNGAAQATLDRYPLLLVTDSVPSDDSDRVAHQRLDQIAMMSPVTKWSGRLGAGPEAKVAAESALLLAGTAPRGAVHLDFDPTSSTDPVPPVAAVEDVGAERIETMRDLVERSTRPVAIVGWGALDDAVGVRRELERLGWPVLTTYQAAGLLPDGHPQLGGLFTGGVLEDQLLGSADMIVAVGLDTVEPMPPPWRYDVPVVSLTPYPAASSYLPAMELVGNPVAVLAALGRSGTHVGEVAAGAAALASVREVLSVTTANGLGPVELARAVARSTPAGATATVDAGAHFLAIMPFWPAAEPLAVLISNGLATMGFALPAAIGAALARRGSPVVCMVGDGGLGMTLAELETVARLSLPITVVVFDDAALSLIEIKQIAGQGGDEAVRFGPIDFAAVATGMGIDAVTVETVNEVETVLARGWDRPRLVDARIDPSPYAEIIRRTRG